MDDVVNVARAEEADKSSQNDLKSGTSVNAVKHMSSYKIRQKYTPTQATYYDMKCTKCCRAWHANITDCPAINIVCLKCNERGHFAMRWKSKECGLKSIQAGRVHQRYINEYINSPVINGLIYLFSLTAIYVDKLSSAMIQGVDIATMGVNEYHALEWFKRGTKTSAYASLLRWS